MRGPPIFSVLFATLCVSVACQQLAAEAPSGCTSVTSAAGLQTAIAALFRNNQPYSLCVAAANDISFQDSQPLVVPPHFSVSVYCGGAAFDVHSRAGNLSVAAQSSLALYGCRTTLMPDTAARDDTVVPVNGMFGNSDGAIFRFLHSFLQYPCMAPIPVASTISSQEYQLNATSSTRAGPFLVLRNATLWCGQSWQAAQPAVRSSLAAFADGSASRNGGFAPVQDNPPSAFDPPAMVGVPPFREPTSYVGSSNVWIVLLVVAITLLCCVILLIVYILCQRTRQISLFKQPQSSVMRESLRTQSSMAMPSTLSSPAARATRRSKSYSRASPAQHWLQAGAASPVLHTSLSSSRGGSSPAHTQHHKPLLSPGPGPGSAAGSIRIHTSGTGAGDRDDHLAAASRSVGTSIRSSHLVSGESTPSNPHYSPHSVNSNPYYHPITSVHSSRGSVHSYETASPTNQFSGSIRNLPHGPENDIQSLSIELRFPPNEPAYPSHAFSPAISPHRVEAAFGASSSAGLSSRNAATLPLLELGTEASGSTMLMSPTALTVGGGMTPSSAGVHTPSAALSSVHTPRQPAGQSQESTDSGGLEAVDDQVTGIAGGMRTPRVIGSFATHAPTREPLRRDSYPHMARNPLDRPGSDDTVSSSSEVMMVKSTVSTAIQEMQTELRSELGEDQLVIDRVLSGSEAHTVYQGTWHGLPVAIKSTIFNPEIARENIAVIASEAAIACTLSHPNIVSTYTHDVCECTDPENQDPKFKFYLIQELCNGGSLRDALRDGIFRKEQLNMRWRPVISMLIGIASGMDHMHSLRICHGNLHDSNVLMKYNSSVHANLRDALMAAEVDPKITDFCAAQRMQRARMADGYQSSNKLAVFMAPEVEREKRLHQASDVFAFGVIMWELMMGVLVTMSPRRQRSSTDEEGEIDASSSAGREIGQAVDQATSSGSSASVPEWLKGLEAEEAHVRREYCHPDYPNLPSEAPLTYVLTMKACLCERPAERPTFSQVITLLRDLQTEILRGVYMDSEGTEQTSDRLGAPMPSPPLPVVADESLLVARGPHRPMYGGPYNPASIVLPHTIVEEPEEEGSSQLRLASAHASPRSSAAQ